MASRLEELVTSQSEFSAHASHELRSPLTALRLRLENLEPALVRRRGLDDLEAAIEETQRLARIVDGLLVLARSGGSGPERESLDVNAAVRERVAAWTALAEEREVDLAVSAAGVQLAEAVPGHVDQILDNYLANALEVSHPGAIVTVQTEREGPWVEVHVLDERRRARSGLRTFLAWWREPRWRIRPGSLDCPPACRPERRRGPTPRPEGQPGRGRGGASAGLLKGPRPTRDTLA
jgi:light-regulated signal transduction histidine kinase (bacteriophytochrome)